MNLLEQKLTYRIEKEGPITFEIFIETVLRP
jgi:hypothetical protein